ncbi:MAG TPA: hypothetical protein VFL91_29180, partial [Thermomicrobiales bacterium]|nr:hypothetical protein [Thermomicrobiales bacterium]
VTAAQVAQVFPPAAPLAPPPAAGRLTATWPLVPTRPEAWALLAGGLVLLVVGLLLGGTTLRRRRQPAPAPAAAPTAAPAVRRAGPPTVRWTGRKDSGV